jgi:hypothetical protein
VAKIALHHALAAASLGRRLGGKDTGLASGGRQPSDEEEGQPSSKKAIFHDLILKLVNPQALALDRRLSLAGSRAFFISLTLV